jgi:hypothetical protein
VLLSIPFMASRISFVVNGMSVVVIGLSVCVSVSVVAVCVVSVSVFNTFIHTMLHYTVTLHVPFYTLLHD